MSAIPDFNANNAATPLPTYQISQDAQKTSETQGTVKTSASIISRSQVSPSAAQLLSGPSLGAIRNVVSGSMAVLQTADNHRPSPPVATSKSNLQAPLLTSSVKKQQAPTPLNALKEREVTIGNTPRADILKGLWQCSKPASFFNGLPPEARQQVLQKIEKEEWADMERIEAQLKNAPRVDYFAGRCIKTSIQDPLDLSSYTKYCDPEMTPEQVMQKCVLPKN